MPELPEVETVAQGLAFQIEDYTIKDIEVNDETLLRNINEAALRRRLVERKVLEVRRKGKYLILDVEGAGLVVIHLRMTGKLLVCPPEKDAKHQRIAFDFREGKRLIMDNMRRFGTLDLLNSENEEPLVSLGLDPFSEEYEWEKFRTLFDSTRSLKNILLDQSKVCGLGNIYVNEVLFLAGLDPFMPGEELREKEKRELFELIPELLSEAIDNNGTTFDTFLDSSGQSGDFQNFLKIYQKEGKPCPICGASIQKVKQSGRGTYYCENCQGAKECRRPEPT